MKPERFTELILKYAGQAISPEEMAELHALLENDIQLPETLAHTWMKEGIREPVDEAQVQRHILAITSVDRHPFILRRIPFFRRWRWAAAVLLLVCSLAAILLHQQPSAPVTATAGDVVPGGNKATLTLSDGTIILLDSLGNGTIARQGGAAVVKRANGQIVYQLQASSNKAVVLNTLNTPRGGQHQLTLPDGTKVWLNAASSITFPTAFTERERKVSIKGEVYFEVAPQSSQPFIVDAGGGNSIEVLGTSFNINSYAEETAAKATLLEGSIRVAANGRRLMLTPGQQAVIGGSQLSLRTGVDKEQAIAWKNGVFNFEGLSFREAMRQLERWYDISVIYEGRTPDIRFRGDMNRGIPLSGVVRMLSAFGVKARIEAKQLIIE